jgi:hypothetical protein
MADPGSPKAVVLEFHELAFEQFQPKDASPDLLNTAPLCWVVYARRRALFSKISYEGFPLQSRKSFALPQKVLSFFCMST